MTAQSTNAYYYGSSSFGWNYPIWSSISFNNQQGNPYALQVIDDYAHCGIVASQSYTSFRVQGTIRNDSSTDNLEVGLFKASTPDGSSSNMTLTELDTQAITVSNQDRHYDVDFTTSSGCIAGRLIFLGIARTAGTYTYTIRQLQHFNPRHTMKNLDDFYTPDHTARRQATSRIAVAKIRTAHRPLESGHPKLNGDDGIVEE